MMGDKVVAFCDRNFKVIAPFIVAPGNRNESPLLSETLPQVMTARVWQVSLCAALLSAWMASTIAEQIAKQFSIAA